jgi:hypothetical protein
MSYLKIYSKTELNIAILTLDYKSQDEDSVFYPLPTFEYFFEEDYEEGYTDELYQDFVNKVQFIFGILDALKIDYDYTIMDAEYLNEEDENYKQGYKSDFDNSI